jgi:hypothetical protein
LLMFLTSLKCLQYLIYLICLIFHPVFLEVKPLIVYLVVTAIILNLQNFPISQTYLEILKMFTTIHGLVSLMLLLVFIEDQLLIVYPVLIEYLVVKLLQYLT